jgi:hypothetical protein
MFASLPLTALRAFESASRLLSFKAAAEELSVTPTAVSHQIRSLETWLGVQLFERLPRQVRLTEGGERLFHSLHGAFLEVAQSVDTLRPHRSGTSLTISTTAAFAALWLVPRLGRFYARHPNISLRLDTHCEVIDLHQDASVDLVVRYSLDDYPNLYGVCLFDESFGVYGSPEQVALAGIIPNSTPMAGRPGVHSPAKTGWRASPSCANTMKSITPCKRRLPVRGWCWRAIFWCRKVSPVGCFCLIGATCRWTAPVTAPCACRGVSDIRQSGRFLRGCGKRQWYPDMPCRK